jgi:hypothetical protein
MKFCRRRLSGEKFIRCWLTQLVEKIVASCALVKLKVKIVFSSGKFKEDMASGEATDQEKFSGQPDKREFARGEKNLLGQIFLDTNGEKRNPLHLNEFSSNLIAHYCS